MSTTPTAGRVRDDACPGVLRLTEAADGFLARVRLVGGFLTAQGFSTLAGLAGELGDGRLELTSRGNVQLRGLAPDAGAELGARLQVAGLWPSATHERVRNIIASPLAGLDRPGSLTDLVSRLDRALCARPRLAELSGRFLFAVDDGRGDVATLEPDVLIQGRLVNGLAASDSVEAALAVAEAFLAERDAQSSTAWRIADLADGQRRVQARLGIPSAPQPVGASFTGPPPAGMVKRPDDRRALVLAVPLGRLGFDQLSWLAAVTGAEPARVTPWRSIVLPDADPALLSKAAGLGFGVTADSPWSNVSACAGKPGCAKALADVQADALAGLDRWRGRVVHWSGCGRRCGRPGRTEIDLIATESGYMIEGI